MINIFHTLTDSIVHGAGSTFLFSDTIKYDSFCIIIASNFFAAQGNNCWNRLMYSTAPAKSASRRSKGFPTIFWRHMTHRFKKPKLAIMFFCSFHRFECRFKFHAGITENNNKFVRSQSLGNKVEQNETILTSRESNNELHSFGGIFIMNLAYKLNRFIFKPSHEAFIFFPQVFNVYCFKC